VSDDVKFPPMPQVLSETPPASTLRVTLPEGHRLVHTMPQQKPGQSKQDYATPRAFIEAVEKRFGPLIHDLAAHKENTRCATFYSEADDSLMREWAMEFPRGNLWLNPPFSRIDPWAAKCAKESASRCGLILFLTPASVGSEWFANHVEKQALVLALRPRLSFDGKNPYPKDCILSVFGLGITGFATWRWDE
jgi:phage N-6-adenine-methyltransferase